MPLLEVEHLHARYDFAPVLRGISFNLDAGEIVGIIGRNGAGKTTTLRAIMGWLRPAEGRIAFDGEAIGGWSPDRIFRRGIAFIPEDRRIFATLSVEENLMLGLFSRRQSGAEQRRRLDRVFDLFPRLRERRLQRAKTLSGGEQQMLAIGRELIGRCCCWWTSCPKGLRPSSSTKSSIAGAHAGLGSRCCWWAERPPRRRHQHVPLSDGRARSSRTACGGRSPTKPSGNDCLFETTARHRNA